MSTPRSWYRRAQCTTSRRLAATICLRAASSPATTRLASSTCCSWSGMGIGRGRAASGPTCPTCSPRSSSSLQTLFRSLSVVRTRPQSGIEPDGYNRDSSSGSFHGGVRTEVAPSSWPVVVYGPWPGRMVLLRHGATEWSENGNTRVARIFPSSTRGVSRPKAAGEMLRERGSDDVRPGADQPAAPGRRDLRPGRVRRGARARPDGVGLRRLRGADQRPRSASDDPGWTLWDDGVPEGERAADVGRRADRVIERARDADGDTLCVAHGHLLRVLAARWLGLPPVAGRLLPPRTGAVCVLGWELDCPAIEAWNLGPAP